MHLFPAVILSFISSCFFISCAGKPINSPSKRIRHIPETEKTVYIGMIYNHSSFRGIERDLRRYLMDYFFTSEELISSIDLYNSDVFLEIEIKDFVTNDLLVAFPNSLNKKTIYLLSLKVSFKDIQTKKIYVDGVEFKSSFLQETTLDKNGGYGKNVKKELFKEVGRNIEHLVRTGNVLIRSKFGYEDLKEKEKTWLEENRKASSFSNNIYQYGAIVKERSTNLTEKDRLQEIKRRDKHGFRSYQTQNEKQ